MPQYEQMTDEQLIRRLREGDRAITDYLMEKYKEQFLAPESFVRIGGKILAVKQPVPGTENKDMTQKPPHKSGPEL